MTLEVQLLRPSITGILIPIERIAFPIQQLEPAKDTAKSLLASPERDPKATVARVIDRSGRVLFCCRVEDGISWSEASQL